MVVSYQSRAVGVFATRQDAEQALNELKSSSFPMDKVSIIARDAQELIGEAQASDRVGNQNVKAASGVVAETLTNSALGTVLVGLGSLAIPGIGPIIAAGSLGVALVATVASSGVEALAFNGLVKAFTDLGIPEEQARMYSDRLHKGNYVVIVDATEDDLRRATEIFEKQGIQAWNIYHPALS